MTMTQTQAVARTNGNGAQPKMTPLELFKEQVLPPDRQRELSRALPAHIRPERFERNLVNALMQNPDLMKCDPRLVYREVAKAAALGLVLDPQLGEGYIVLRWSGKAQRNEPLFQAGYRGIIKLARQSGEVAAIYAHEVCQNDEIECLLGDAKKLHHRPHLFGDRGPAVGYYAVVKFKDGTTDFEPMTIDQINKVRERSDAWRAFSAGKIKSTPWATDYDEMAKKTVLRRLLKRLPQSPDLADLIADEDRAEAGTEAAPRDVTPARPQLQGGKLDALEAGLGDAAEGDGGEDQGAGEPADDGGAALDGEVEPPADPDYPIVYPQVNGKPSVSAYMKVINEEIGIAPSPEMVDRIIAREAPNLAKSGNAANGIKLAAEQRKAALREQA